MRLAFLLLLLANLAFFAWRYYVTHYASPGQQVVAQQLQPDRIKPITSAEFGRRAAASQTFACLEFGPLASGDAARAQDAVQGLQAGLRLAERRVEEPVGWWVFIPPLPTRQAALARIAELKKQGAGDTSLMPEDSKLPNAVSLGVFATEAAAASRLEGLRGRGIRDAEVMARSGAGSRVFLQLRDVPGTVRARLEELKPAFPGADVRECTAEEKRG